jgi:hypothetical protein
MDSEEIVIWDDDGPDGRTTCLVISVGGNGDWYMQIDGRDFDDKPMRSDGFRACTDGAKHPIVTLAVAMLAAIGRGDRQRATSLAASIADGLENGILRVPERR